MRPNRVYEMKRTVATSQQHGMYTPPSQHCMRGLQSLASLAVIDVCFSCFVSRSFVSVHPTSIRSLLYVL